jgi:hypothetical protein
MTILRRHSAVGSVAALVAFAGAVTLVGAPVASATPASAVSAYAASTSVTPAVRALLPDVVVYVSQKKATVKAGDVIQFELPGRDQNWKEWTLTSSNPSIVRVRGCYQCDPGMVGAFGVGSAERAGTAVVKVRHGKSGKVFQVSVTVVPR